MAKPKREAIIFNLSEYAAGGGSTADYTVGRPLELVGVLLNIYQDFTAAPPLFGNSVAYLLDADNADALVLASVRLAYDYQVAAANNGPHASTVYVPLPNWPKQTASTLRLLMASSAGFTVYAEAVIYAYAQ